MGMRYEKAPLGAVERTLVDLRRKIVAMLGLHIDQWMKGSSRQLHAIVSLVSDHRVPLLVMRGRMILRAIGVELGH